MRKYMYNIISIALILGICFSLFSVNYISAEESTTDVFADLAFPTAEGYGRFVSGFRGGQVVKVTNLEAEGEGSLRWALEDVSGPRIVVFEVGGVIDLDKSELMLPITITEGNVYVAGQTAPGDGITIVGDGLMINASNVVIRDLRIRPGEGVWFGSCIEIIGKSENVIIDHCSLSWGECSNIAIENSENVTVQNCILAESIGYHGASEALIYYLTSGSAVELNVQNASFYKNFITNCSNKIWGFSYEYEESISSASGDNSNVDIRNNVVYNWYSATSGIASKSTQFVNNYYKKGERTKNETLLNLNGTGYISGNKMVDSTGTIIVDADDENPWIIASEDSFPDGRSNEALFYAGVNTLTAEETYEYVLHNVGANVPTRDYIDERYLSEIANGTHTYGSDNLDGFIYTQKDAEGLPDNTTFTGGDAPVDTDDDGMPDEWELLHGLDPENYYDACQVYLSDEGYTNIELYINELARDPVKYSENPTVQYTPPTPTPSDTPAPTEEVIKTPMATEEITENPETIEPDYLTGDVNADGVVNADDALAILKHAAKLEILTEEKILKADVEPNEMIDASDALVVLKIAAKIE